MKSLGVGFLGIFALISSSVQAALANMQVKTGLRTKQAQLKAVNDASPLGLVYTNVGGECSYVNRTMEQMVSRPLERLHGRRWRRCLHPFDRSRVLAELAHWDALNDPPYTTVCRLGRNNDPVLWVSLKVVPVLVAGKLTGYVGSLDDITSRRSNELALIKSEQKLRLITDNIPALVAYVTGDERIAFANRRYEEAYGILHEEIAGMSACEVLGPDVYAQSRDYIRQALAGTPALFERCVKCEHGLRYERVSYIPDIDQQGAVTGYFGLVEDITALKQVEAQLRQLVRVDPLTGIANRLQFDERLIDAIRYSRRYETGMALLFLDVDNFKEINDSYGHQGGDQVLREFAQRLQSCVRDTDTVARIAGDEFVIILEGLTEAPEEAQGVARKIIAAMQTPFEICGRQRIVTTSIGVAVRRPEEEDAKVLLGRADEALYRAKSAGRNTFETNPDSMDVF
ncbi:PAS domain S-box-containing protein/diguanylate cyclase (GGDEF)-like protein [Paucimonas lemoignei]|uniref:PAS domain S-box-containing protein/diguanylate cyclase (GGDEF)-like protein n=1 Tax=Paucimonas lemoignei TaxID=29443 RepID=A0A4R3I0I9_PAULE|nr:GGDEF domain-containing protein [Paucimonas lemoignei]TCS39207.1 PAS domain S-box-containing protein/diguanylate cyclase (GGDEF)-like protein [Paucimonas lemoignei]